MTRSPNMGKPACQRPPILNQTAHAYSQQEMDTNIAYSIFETAMDNQPKAKMSTWPGLCCALAIDRQPAPQPVGTDPKKYLPAISGAFYPPGSTRTCAHVVGLQLAIFDIDNSEEFETGEYHPSGRPKLKKRPISAPATIGAVCDELERLGIAAYAYSTWSHSEEWPRFRLIVPLASVVLPDLWPNAISWVLSVSGLLKWRESIDLPCSLDVARLNFLPAQRPGGPPVERREVKGEILEPPSPERLPLAGVPKQELAPWQKQALAKHTEQPCFSNKPGRCSWAARFRSSDGKLLDLKTLDAVRLLEGLGCRVSPGRAWRGGTKHRTSCPWSSEHSHALDDDCGVLFLESGRWPSWHCSHSHHAHLGLADLLEAAGVLSVA